MKNWIKLAIGVWLTVVIVVAIATPIQKDDSAAMPVGPTAVASAAPAANGSLTQQRATGIFSGFHFGYIPGLGERARILFFHVPMSWIAVLAFLMSMWYGITYLRKKNMKDDLKSAAAAELGFIFCVLATVTGSIWAKFNWGSFWNWDPRETSIFVLLLIYGAYFSLRSALEVEERRASLSAVYSIVAFVTVPFFIFIMPRITFSLHPGGAGSAAPILNMNGKMYMDTDMQYVFFASLIGFTGLYLWLFQLRTRIALMNYFNHAESV